MNNKTALRRLASLFLTVFFVMRPAFAADPLTETGHFIFGFNKTVLSKMGIDVRGTRYRGGLPPTLRGRALDVMADQMIGPVDFDKDCRVGADETVDLKVSISALPGEQKIEGRYYPKITGTRLYVENEAVLPLETEQNHEVLTRDEFGKNLVTRTYRLYTANYPPGWLTVTVMPTDRHGRRITNLNVGIFIDPKLGRRWRTETHRSQQRIPQRWSDRPGVWVIENPSNQPAEVAICRLEADHRVPIYIGDQVSGNRQRTITIPARKALNLGLPRAGHYHLDCVTAGLSPSSADVVVDSLSERVPICSLISPLTRSPEPPAEVVTPESPNDGESGPPPGETPPPDNTGSDEPPDAPQGEGN